MVKYDLYPVLCGKTEGYFYVYGTIDDSETRTTYDFICIILREKVEILELVRSGM